MMQRCRPRWNRPRSPRHGPNGPADGPDGPIQSVDGRPAGRCAVQLVASTPSSRHGPRRIRREAVLPWAAVGRPVTPAAEPGAGGGIPSEGTEVGWRSVFDAPPGSVGSTSRPCAAPPGGCSPGLAATPRPRHDRALIRSSWSVAPAPAEPRRRPSRDPARRGRGPRSALADPGDVCLGPAQRRAIRSVTHRYHTPMSGPRSIQPALPGFSGRRPGSADKRDREQQPGCA